MRIIPLSFHLDSPRWLPRLRWFAILGMAASILGARIIQIKLPLLPIALLLNFLILWNFILLRYEEEIFSSHRDSVFIQIAIDLFVLTAILWMSGGLANPFVSFYIFHVLIAGLLLTPILTVFVSLFAIFLVVLLIFAPPLKMPIAWGIPLGLVLLIFCTTGFILVFMRLLERAQEERREREKMVALGQLMSGLAHELGTPLNSILLLAKDLRLNMAKDVTADLAVIEAQAKRCGDLVALLLGYSSGERGITRLGKKSVELNVWLREVFSSAEKSLGAKLAPAKCEISPIQGKFLLPELILRQVFENLFKNSLQATKHVNTPLVKIEIEKDEVNQGLRFCVQDNGSGFDDATKQRAFEAFYTTKSIGEGVGLGLYISYFLMQQIGGKIAIEEAPLNGGASISMWVPV